jgi:hypothetical protein
MAVVPVVHIGENSPEEVAHKLMREIARVEQRSFKTRIPPNWKAANRKWILDTYAECLEAVKGNRLNNRQRRNLRPQSNTPQSSTWMEADQLPESERK